MSATILIKEGTYRNVKVVNEAFVLVEQFKQGKKGGYVTVANNGRFPGFPEQVKIKVAGVDSYEFAGGSMPTATVTPVIEQTDGEIAEEINHRFDMLHEMTKASIAGDIRAMIVVGPPGVGKSFGVEQELERSTLFSQVANKPLPYSVIKGASSALGLYTNLFKYSEKGCVVVFDDCDTPLHDELCLNLLKGALDSGKSRRISWNSDSHTLRREGIPDSFEFRGSVIIITNTKFDHIRSPKLRDHLDALQSRCHYLDLSMDTPRHKIIRIQEVAKTGELFAAYDFTKEQEEMVLDFIYREQDNLSEVSLRMGIKVADLLKSFPEKWEQYAKELCFRRRTQR